MVRKAKTETPDYARESGIGHERYEPGTDFRLMWKWEKCYLLDWIILECCTIISSTEEKKLPQHIKSPDSKNCKKYCMGCRYFPKPIHFDPDRIFSLYCPKHDINNLCSFLSMQYYCDKLYDFLRGIGIDEITEDLFQEVEAICNLIGKKVYKLAGLHNKALAIKELHINGPGAASRVSGETTIKRAIEILEKHGGIDGYDNLPRGQKVKVIDTIEKTLNLDDPRHVYNILNKIRSLPKST